MKLRVGIIGATGVVGIKTREILEERNFPVDNLRLFASVRSAGKKFLFKNSEIQVEELTESSLKNIDIAFFSAGSSVSKQFVPIAVKNGAIVIDKSSLFRMKNEVPLVVPEVNPHRIKEHKGIIANPNCSTIQFVVALKPIHDKFRIKSVVVTTFQSVSGAGTQGIYELKEQSSDILNGKEIKKELFPHQIAFNPLPQIPQKNAFLPNGYTSEEMKMIEETQKIMEDSSIQVSPTCVRVPVFVGHSEAVEIECEKDLSAHEIRELLRQSPGIEVVDDPSEQLYPLAVNCEDKDPVYVGRIRENLFSKKKLNLWIVSDNLRKGAALNAVQIAEQLIINN